MTEFNEIRLDAAQSNRATHLGTSRVEPFPKPLGSAHSHDVTLGKHSRTKRPPILNGSAQIAPDRQGHRSPAIEAPFDDGAAQEAPDAHKFRSPAVVDPVLGGDGAPHRSGAQTAPSPITAEIVQLWRLRQRWLRAEVALILQAQAICRGWCEGDKKKAAELFKAASVGRCDDPQLMMALSPFLPSITSFQNARKPWDKRLEKLARLLPIWSWAATVKGFGVGNLARIIGEAGDVANYRNPSCLWKRMGLAVIDGGRQRKVKDEELALIHGYSPQRRASAYVLSECLIKKPNQYRPVYDARKAAMMARDGMTKGHAHKDAMRIMVKAVLCDLWRVVHGQEARQ